VMEGVQLRMARAALGLTVREAADATGVSHDTIIRIEAGQVLKPSTLAKVRSGFERSGIMFIDDGQGPGIRLRRSGQRDEGLRPDELTSENDG
jgi:transcriptional regulator with XRE-family HTH domain